MRSEAVAGSFYPESKKELRAFVENSIGKADIDEDSIKNAYSYVAPHAGYIYSGNTAAFTYKALSFRSNLKDLETVVVIGPNHTDYGTAISVSLNDWKTSLQIARNDRDFSSALAESSGLIQIDESAHKFEHSVEVQLPFIQSVAPHVKFAFVCMGDQGEEASNALFKAILKAESATGRKIAVIASSDLNHYESSKTAASKDMKIIEALARLDSKRFNKLIDELNDSACGYGPITTAMLYAGSKGAREGILLKYSNSGDTTGDYSSVVAYASLAFV